MSLSGAKTFEGLIAPYLRTTSRRSTDPMDFRGFVSDELLAQFNDTAVLYPGTIFRVTKKPCCEDDISHIFGPFNIAEMYRRLERKSLHIT